MDIEFDLVENEPNILQKDDGLWNIFFNIIIQEQNCWQYLINRVFYYINSCILYKKILSTLFTWNAEWASIHIMDIYQNNGFCIVDYMYFANVAGKRLFDTYRIPFVVDDFRDLLLSGYKTIDKNIIYSCYQKSILDANVVLIDGIALQLFYYLDQKKWIPNLNGTDFCPYFLSYVKNTISDKPINILLYGTYPHLLEKTKTYLLRQGYNVIYAQDWYTNLDWDNIDLALKGRQQHINILLVARTTPEYPIQEIRTFTNKFFIKHHWLIVLNQWGTFDFWVGEQKRPPRYVRKIKLERLWRLISDPKRNIKKVLSSLALFKYIFLYLILKKK